MLLTPQCQILRVHIGAKHWLHESIVRFCKSERSNGNVGFCHGRCFGFSSILQSFQVVKTNGSELVLDGVVAVVSPWACALNDDLKDADVELVAFVEQSAMNVKVLLPDFDG